MDQMAGIDWAQHWSRLVRDRAEAAGGHSDPSYWDRRARSFARSTRSRVDDFLEVVAPFVSARRTLIDVGAGAGRFAVPLAERLEWVTAVEPSDGMRALIPPRDNITVVAGTWEDAQVAPADLVICCHVLYGVDEPVPFIVKLEKSARERVFIMLREGPIPHPATILRQRMVGVPEPRLPNLSDLFLLLMQIGIAPDVAFLRYPAVNRYTSMDEALADCRSLISTGWDEAKARALLQEMLVPDGSELTFDCGVTVSGIAHWRPRTSTT